MKACDLASDVCYLISKEWSQLSWAWASTTAKSRVGGVRALARRRGRRLVGRGPYQRIVNKQVLQAKIHAYHHTSSHSCKDVWFVVSLQAMPNHNTHALPSQLSKNFNGKPPNHNSTGTPKYVMVMTGDLENRKSRSIQWYIDQEHFFWLE